MSGATMHIALLAFIFASSLATFVILFFIRAPYGRYGRKGWGPSVPARIAWMAMEGPAVAVILAAFILGDNKTLPSFAFICLWQMHYIYRTFIYPLNMRGANKEFPIVLVLMALIYNSANGYVNGWRLFISPHGKTTDWVFDIRFISGVLVFCIGFIIHFTSDKKLRNLRSSGDTSYHIPMGGLYRYISAPNYFGEILQWLGWALATWTLAGLSFALFTIANLLPRGISHHAWYRSNFKDYPQNRRAVIPFIL